MSLFANPSPQWQDIGLVASGIALRLAPVLDASGFWVFPEGIEPDGAMKDDPSGFTVIDDTTTVGLKETILPSGYMVTY